MKQRIACKNTKTFSKDREEIIEGFIEGIFQLNFDSESEQQTSKKAIKTNVNKFNEGINQKETGINKELFEKYFNFQAPSSMAKYLYKTNDRDELVSVINSGLKDLKKETEKMS